MNNAPIAFLQSPEESTETFDAVSQWPRCNPNKVIKQLRELLINQFGRNGKAYWKSYPSWEKQTASQKANTLDFWSNLEKSIQTILTFCEQRSRQEIENNEAESKASLQLFTKMILLDFCISGKF
jgi:hypothetical protein